MRGFLQHLSSLIECCAPTTGKIFTLKVCCRLMPPRCRITVRWSWASREGILGKKRFHFESFWTKLEGFHDAVQRSWEEPVLDCSPLLRISIKLKRLAKALQSWSQKQVGNINSQLALARHILHNLEVAQDHRELSAEEDWLRCKLKKHCLVLASLERTIARLRSRIRYLKENDANTSFFHKQAGFRKHKKLHSKACSGRSGGYGPRGQTSDTP